MQNIRKLLTQATFLFVLVACQPKGGEEMRKDDYWVSYKSKKEEKYAKRVLDYISEQKFDLKRFQILHPEKDTVLVRVFGKPKGKQKTPEQKKFAIFGMVLLANDLSKVCFDNKPVRVMLGESFGDPNRYLEGVSDGKVGYKDYNFKKE
ncbi:MAG: hypothetical protein SFU27_07205 [Thermonemataceae bacterium]|nr:hypothetical protein [Thermonemataceae bacterium]